MNEERLNLLNRSLELIQDACSDLEMVRDDEQDAFDNMPEGLQESERGDIMQECIDTLDDAVAQLEDVAMDLEEVCSSAEDDEAADYNPFAHLAVGDTVYHKSLGEGKIKTIDSKYLTVLIGDKEMRFLNPDAFLKGFLSI